MTVRRLNILLSYPVKWSLREIFRDYIQNFYDSPTESSQVLEALRAFWSGVSSGA